MADGNGKTCLGRIVRLALIVYVGCILALSLVTMVHKAVS
jgi:hypothetical protein